MGATKSEREYKAALRARWRAEGWTEINIRVAADQADKVREFVAGLPGPKAPENPGQQVLPFGGPGDE